MNRLVLGAVAILVVFSTCTFHADGDKLTEIEVPAPTTTVINFFESQDILLVRGHFNISMTTKSSEPIKEYQVQVDAKMIFTSEGPPSFISFNTKDYPDGIHTITVEVTKHRVGESVASQAGLEVYTQTYSRQIEIYNKTIAAPAVTATIEDGALVLKWAPYVGYRFESYRIECPELLLYQEILIQDQGSLRIPGFIGGAGNFKLNLNAFNEHYTSSVKYETFHDAKIEKTQTGLKCKWTKSPFANCAGFKVSMDINGVHQEFEFPNETKEVDLPASDAFPYEITGKIQVVPPTEFEDDVVLTAENYSSIQPIGGTTHKSRLISQFIRHPTIDSLMFIYYDDGPFNNGILALHGRKSGKEIKTLFGRIAVSPNGEQLFSYNTTSKNIVRLDPTDLSEKEGTPLQNIIGSSFLTLFRLSNGNKLLFATPTTNKYLVFDWNEQKALFTSAPAASASIREAGALGNGGKAYYNTGILQVVQFDNDPGTTYSVPQLGRVTILTNVDKCIFQDGNNFTVNTLPGFTQLYSGKGPNKLNNVVRTFSNQENVFGVVYIIDNSKVKIDFFDHRDLTFLTTLETQLPTLNISKYIFSLVGNELFVYWDDYTSGKPVHSIKLDL